MLNVNPNSFGTHIKIFQLLPGALFTLVWWVVFLVILSELGDRWRRHYRCSLIDQLIVHVIKLVCPLILIHCGLVSTSYPNCLLEPSCDLGCFEVYDFSLLPPNYVIGVEIFRCEYQKNMDLDSELYNTLYFMNNPDESVSCVQNMVCTNLGIIWPNSARNIFHTNIVSSSCDLVFKKNQLFYKMGEELGCESWNGPVLKVAKCML